MKDSKPEVVCVGPREKWGLDDWKVYAHLQEKLHQDAMKGWGLALETSEGLLKDLQDLLQKLELITRDQQYLPSPNFLSTFHIKRGRGRPKRTSKVHGVGLLSGLEPRIATPQSKKRGRRRKYEENIAEWLLQITRVRSGQHISVRKAIGQLLKQLDGKVDEGKREYLAKRVSEFTKQLKEQTEVFRKLERDVEISLPGGAVRRIHKGNRY